MSDPVQIDIEEAIAETTSVFLDGKVELRKGDCRDVLRAIPDNSIDSVVTDPPYALVSIVKRFGGKNAAPAKSNGATGAYERASRGFMNQTWDTGETAFATEFWAEVLRVLKPGGFVVAFSGTRTYHRMACAIENAGFEIRDQIASLSDNGGPMDQFMASLNEEQLAAFARVVDDAMPTGTLLWGFGSGFPKSHNLSAAIDKGAGAERTVVSTRDLWGSAATGGRAGQLANGEAPKADGSKKQLQITAPTTDAAKQWSGWGSALKPAHEPICLARKPMIGTLAQNVLKYGVGALNIDACRIKGNESTVRHNHGGTGNPDQWRTGNGGDYTAGSDIGRWPANLMTDGSEQVVAAFPYTESGKAAPGGHQRRDSLDAEMAVYSGGLRVASDAGHLFGDSGSASRFFYSSKADSDDRIASRHPTVKPVSMMRELVKLVCPKGGVVLDPFAGTGTTGEAAWIEGMRAILVEREPEYQADIARRMDLITQPTKRSAVAKTKNKLDDPNDLPLFASK